MESIPVGVWLTASVFILSLAAGWGSIWTQLKGINRRLDAQNGRLDKYGGELRTQGKDIANLKGTIGQG